VLGYAVYTLDRLLADKGVQQASSCVTGINELLIALGILALGAPLLAYFGFRSMRNRLGSDGHYLHVQTHQGRHLTLDPVRVVYTHRLLAYEDQLFPIQTGNRKSLYAEGEIESHIGPLLGRAKRLGVLAMLRYQIRHREPTTMASIFYIVIVAVALAYTGLWRIIFPAN